MRHGPDSKSMKRTRSATRRAFDKSAVRPLEEVGDDRHHAGLVDDAPDARRVQVERRGVDPLHRLQRQLAQPLLVVGDALVELVQRAADDAGEADQHRQVEEHGQEDRGPTRDPARYQPADDRAARRR